MKKLLSFVIVCVCASVVVMAQKKDVVVSGLVQDKQSTEPVMQATVRLLTVKDSAFVAGGVSDLDGRFLLPAVVSGSYLMKVSYTGYVPTWKNLTLKKSVDIGTIELTQDAVLLKQATVTAQLAEMQVSEDTVIYNAGAFRVPQGSMLEELVKKLPGAEVDENGKITINGKEVRKIMMNGKEFFSGDTETAMKNVPVEMVEKLKAYDKQSDLARVTGIDDGEEETVLDLTVKKGMNKGWFGNVDAAYGTEDRYSGSAIMNRYDDAQQMTLLGNANNVGGRGFPGGGGGFRGGGGGGGGGLQANKDAGFNFAFEKGNIEMGGDVRYRHRDTDSKTKSASETFLQSGNSFSNSLRNSLGCSENIEANFRLEWEPDSMTNIIFRPRFTFDRSDNWSESTSATFNENPFDLTQDPLREAYNPAFNWGDTLVNTNRSKTQSNSDSWNASGSLQVNRRLNNEGRNITFRGSYSYSDSENKSISASEVKYFQTQNGRNDIRNRYNVTPGKNWNYSAQFTYSEPILYQTFLQFSYRFTESYSKNDRSTYDFSKDYPNYLFDGFPIVPNNYEDYIDNEQSQFSEYYNYTHEAQAMLRVIRDKYQFNIGFTALPQKTKMEYKYLKIDTTVTRNVLNFTPNVRFRYNWTKQHQIDIRYQGRSSQPSMTDMLDFLDDTDPLNIRQGNPGLKPSFSHNLNANYRKYIIEKQRGIFATLGGQLTQNSVSSMVTYDTETGGRTTRPENINGNWNVNGNFGFNTALRNKKFNVSTNTRATYSNQVQYLAQNGIDSRKNTTRTINVGENLRGSYRQDWDNNMQVEFSLTGNLNYQHAENKLQPDRNLDTYIFAYGGSTNLTFPWGTSLSTDISMNSRRGFSEASMNTNELLWNAQVSHRLFNGAASLSLQFYDILHEQSNISRTINAAMRNDTESNAINSYCMLHFIYRLNIFGDNQNAFRGGPRGEGGGFPGGGRGGMGGARSPMGGFGGGMGGGRPF